MCSSLTLIGVYILNISYITAKYRYVEVVGTIFLQDQITRSANKFALRVTWTCKKVSNAKLWLEKAIKTFFFIQFRRI